jgi:hypothetical protein
LRLRNAPLRLEQAADQVALRIEAREVVRADIDRDQRDLALVRLQKLSASASCVPFEKTTFL